MQHGKNLKNEVVQNRYFLAPNFLGDLCQKNVYIVFYSRPIDVVLKFRKDPFRGIDGIAWKKATFAKRMPSLMAVAMAVAKFISSHQGPLI